MKGSVTLSLLHTFNRERFEPRSHFTFNHNLLNKSSPKGFAKMNSIPQVTGANKGIGFAIVRKLCKEFSSLRSKRFRLVSGQRNTEEGDFRF